MKTLIYLGIALASTGCLFAQADKKAKQAKPANKIEVCFVLDSTGSMGGLIEGAKAKIWSIVQEMQEAKPKPKVSMGLVGFRDRGDAYVTKVTKLSKDLDAVYAQLIGFQAQGGGDTPESVNQALHEAVTQMNWSKDKQTYRVIFLVGDAPPHMDYDDEVKYPEICKIAKKKDILLNTIQCGGITGTQQVWTEIAQQGGGSFAAIQQNGGVQLVKTPFDEKINACNNRINGTVVAWGDAKMQLSCVSKVGNAVNGSLYANASRACWNVANNDGKAITGNEDLVAEWQDKKVELAKLKPEQLPEALRKLDLNELQAHLKGQLETRQKLLVEMKGLAKKRDEFIKAETEKKRKLGELADSFDEQVRGMVRRQGAAKGLSY